MKRLLTIGFLFASMSQIAAAEGGTSSGGSMPAPQGLVWVVPMEEGEFLDQLDGIIEHSISTGQLEKKHTKVIAYPNGVLAKAVCVQSSIYPNLQRLDQFVKMNDLPVNHKDYLYWRGACEGDKPVLPVVASQFIADDCTAEVLAKTLYDECQRDLLCKFRTTTDAEKQELLAAGYKQTEGEATYHKCPLVGP